MSIALAAAIIILLLAWRVGFPLWVVMTEPEDDIRRLKAEFEGLQGRAGPNAQVVNIKKVGASWGSPYGSPSREYEVIVKLLTGDTRRRNVWVAASLLGQGEISERSPKSV